MQVLSSIYYVTAPMELFEIKSLSAAKGSEGEFHDKGHMHAKGDLTTCTSCRVEFATIH